MRVPVARKAGISCVFSFFFLTLWVWGYLTETDKNTYSRTKCATQYKTHLKAPLLLQPQHRES